uniref:Uncharacterized protein n=1 Tax=Cajanus cajan TaxID=3821 RepID=A0A151TI78_CAJCA|nr:hypothetical protein KK1_013069 [Cajanus cajan]
MNQIIEELHDMRVSGIIDNERSCWKLDVINELFDPEDCKDILSIPLSRVDDQHYRSWRWSKDLICVCFVNIS